MRKIIIKNEHDLVSDELAMFYVAKVISQGLISKGGTQYCYCSLFANGVAVYADRLNSGTHTFRISKEVNHESK